jgi:hypothetical protein
MESRRGLGPGAARGQGEPAAASPADKPLTGCGWASAEPTISRSAAISLASARRPAGVALIQVRGLRPSNALTILM